ncbi:hypothetical protein BDV35DRAFT_386978 [Aspergillus flavus]|uniref:Glycosyl transferase family 1 domain-containing protein n=1 Tax=Aspergillus flavus TaxID=5059 RepID=A0A5N6HFE1_ASPFL|nr:hypothetical protein BDV35DRAFT_386978 [Aspergillus flavus]
MDKYKPIKAIKTATLTVVMLSHIQYIKDIKTAIIATNHIVNVWDFKDYQLHIYGDMERAPGYTSEYQEIIALKGLREHWLFMNSSISEGLLLAMGEAALTGVPVVCTDEVHRFAWSPTEPWKLGMLGWSNVYNNFSSDQYLREHKQMLWLGKYQSRSYVARGPGSSSNSSGVSKEKWKSSILIKQTQELLTPNSDTWWTLFRPRLKRGSRYGIAIKGTSGTQTPV